MKNKILFLAASLLMITGCTSNNASAPIKPTVKSELKGTYYNTYSQNMVFRKEFQDDGISLFAATYPAFMINADTYVKYTVDQKLSLRRDFTYVYNYSITLANSANSNFGKVEVNMEGTYSYYVKDEFLQQYYVELENPTDGYEHVYGADIASLSELNYWYIHSVPDYSVSFSENASNPTFTLSSYSKGRKVIAAKAFEEGEQNKVEDSMYFRFIIDDIARYSIIKSQR